MSGVRVIALLVVCYLAFLVVFPKFEGGMLNSIAQSQAVTQSDTFKGWVDDMTTCECSLGRMTCTPVCTQDRRLDGSSPRTVATGFFISTFVLTPIISRHLVFIRMYGEHRADDWVFSAVAAMAMFSACVINFSIGTLLGLLAGRPSFDQRWARLLDRWGPMVFVLGCLAPLGFPIGLASLYLGWRRAPLSLFLLAAAVGCASHVLILAAAHGTVLRWWGA